MEFDDALRLLDPADLPSAAGSDGPVGSRILVVDDSVVTLRLLSDALAALGRVRFARSAESAMEIADYWKPDVVVSDIRLGGMSGLDFCRTLASRSAYSSVAFILISGTHAPHARAAALSAGAIDFLEKPLDRNRIISAVRSSLGD